MRNELVDRGKVKLENRAVPGKQHLKTILSSLVRIVSLEDLDLTLLLQERLRAAE